MAAPCVRMASRPLLRFLTSFRQTAVTKTAVRQVSFSFPSRASVQTKGKSENIVSPWKLMGAVCLQRLPVVSRDKNPIEVEFTELMYQMELEKSLLSDHELRLLEDEERMSRKQADDYDSDDDENRGDQEIVTAQDMEDAWEQRLKQFQPAARDGEANDTGSVERCLADSLILLAEQQVGSEKLWLLPQTQWHAGETLRQTAERALSALPGNNFEATFLGNAPCGVYKYKLPAGVRTETLVGAKVFFFKAVLSASTPAPVLTGEPFRWVRKSELQDYLKPAYLKKVSGFILDL